MQPEQEKDEFLMAKAAAGNREFLEVLVRRYADSLLTFIVRMVGNWHRGEELFQEVFLAVWRKRKQYQYPRSFKAWLFTIAVKQVPGPFSRQRSCTRLLSAGGRA
jgi:RNA polymerase sigma-70 factor (ECF subfamily)